MADFYPLLSRAVAGLAENTPEARQALYERARSVLLSQLRSLDPPLPEGDIARERLALEDVIRRVEDDQSGIVDPTWASDDRSPEFEAPEQEDLAQEESQEVAAVDAADYGRRPKLDIQRTSGGGRLRRVVVGGVLLIVVGGIAAIAYINRDQTPIVAPTEQPPQDAERKFDERVGGERAPAPSGQAAPQQQQPQQPQQSQQQQPPQQQAPAQPPDLSAITVAQRAVLYEETGDSSQQQPAALQGQVAWRVDSANVGQSQRLDTVVRADIEIPKAGLTLAFVIRRNTDARLPASHTIEMTFGKTAGGEGRTIKDIGVPQFKTAENTPGVPLEGVPAPVTDNFFLVGLSNLPADVQRNLDLLRNRNWIDIPILYGDRRRGVLAFEKGPSGEQTLAEAFKVWQNP